MNATLVLLLTSLAPLAQRAASEPDADRDGLPDFHERHKYFTDPKKADSDGDGLPDGDWDERREFSYSVRAVMHVMAPFDVASMTDDYQDVRVLEQRPDLLEFEVVVYPLNTVAEAIEGSDSWRKTPAELRDFVRPGACSNWDKALQARLTEELAQKGVDLGALDDVEAAQRVSQWLMERSAFEDSFTTFAVAFEGGRPHLPEHRVADVEETLERFGRTLEEQWERELFGKGMFETRIHGSCTSSAIYLTTGLRAAGLPTRTIVCVPIVDANDAREVAWIESRLTHVGVRAEVRRAVADMEGKWASHTFNEVFVGGRWRRLNYTKLGQNVLDGGTLGLMVHVHTYSDHSEAGLVAWGDRERHPLHAALFGGPNPYSCVSLSDRFGAHARVANEPLGGLCEATIGRLYWYDDPEKDPALSTTLDELGRAGYLFAHVDTDVGGQDFRAFYDAVDPSFVLRARGQEDVPARAIQKWWIDSNKGLRDFILYIAPPDFARLRPGVAYALAWAGKGERLRWKVRDGLTIERPKR